MQIELRKITYSQRHSEETPCYAAELWVDGEKIARVLNRGHGGPDEVNSVDGRERADIDKVRAFIKSTYPPRTTEYLVKGEPMVIEADLELVCHELLEAHLRANDLRRALRSKILFQKEGSEDIFEVSARGLSEPDRVRLVAIVREEHKPRLILNEMPFSDALVIYSKPSGR